MKLRGRVTGLAIGFLLSVGTLSIFAPYVTQYSYEEQNISERLQGPSVKHWMGTDTLGRDLYSRIVYGARMSLAVGLLTAVVALVLGTLVGAVAGYRGGWVDELLMRGVDLISVFPSILLAILLMLLLGRGFVGILVALGVTSWLTQARLVRGQVLQVRELGYVEGQNLRLEFRTAAGQLERLPALAAELVRLPVDVLVVSGPEATLRAARDATRTLPIVMVAVDYDPIALGYIAGLPRPGGNITGVVLQQLEATGKCLELLKDALPQLTRVAVLWDEHSADQLRVAEAAARGLGVQMHALALHQPPADDFEGAIAAAMREGAEALLVLRSPRFFAARARIVALAAQHRLPAMYGSRGYVEAGGLMAYGAYQRDLGPRVAGYVDKLLKGARPATLPVEQPMKFDFTLNLKTAEALGLTLPPHILVFANEVIR